MIDRGKIKMVQCKINLDNYTGQYFPGNTIQGQVIIQLNSDTTLRGVRVTLSCNEHTEWLGSESYYDNDAREQKSRTTQFQGDNEVFSLKQWLYGDQNAKVNLSSGQHIYPFNIQLPQNIPSTYHSEKGTVSYKITATVDRPMALDFEDNMVIVVNSPIDLNTIASATDLQPSSYSDEKTLCCWCCAQGPVTMDVELPKKTLIPGEHVEVKVSLTNMSNTNVEGVSLELKQILTYKVTEPNKEEKEDSLILVDLKDVGLGAHGENTYLFNVTLRPNVELPNFAQCRLFAVEYRYKAITKLPSMHKNLEINMTPKVGHIPLAAQNAGAPYSTQGNLYPDMGWTAGPNPTAPPISEKQQFEGDPGYNRFDQPPAYDTLNN
ncbi:arrestin domain-containing protein 3-like isoform X1 [Sitophilus oryzae]|uniref:Arrestin domain-containing protein 3-like isoform X1 n=1 Tax=Sitophilus oryzae TaxID=7048 RepID=A0A6J2XEW1_SITOR|nr:arrestin domain-containing protein 3-like isoform X1 [Sitophilus oryzae]